MNFNRGLRRRPNRGQMLDYAESLVDRKPVPAQMAGALTGDQEAASEVRAMRDTLEFIAKVPELEPSECLTRAILLEARSARRPEKRAAYRRASALQAVFRGTAYTAAMAFVCLAVFSVAVYQPKESAAAPAAAPATAQAKASNALTPEMLQRTASELRTLSAMASRSAQNPPASPDAWRHLRAADAIDNDIQAALEALERNPGSARATHIVFSSVQRKADSLREFYVDRTL
ncbi:MAG: hypothetical protein GC168_16265 [Candidatus Hydrogenedens sp.]|nr:hypothetical protein [Candidatus Hydrogenedens sp.]